MVSSPFLMAALISRSTSIGAAIAATSDPASFFRQFRHYAQTGRFRETWAGCVRHNNCRTRSGMEGIQELAFRSSRTSAIPEGHWSIAEFVRVDGR
jgi:hypothetical protein